MARGQSQSFLNEFVHTTFFCLTFDLNQSLYFLRLKKDGLTINLLVSWLATLETSQKAFSFFTIPWLYVHTFYHICRLRVRPNTCSYVKIHCHKQCLLAFPTLCCIFKELILVWSSNVSTSKMRQYSENILGNGSGNLWSLSHPFSACVYCIAFTVYSESKLKPSD